VSGERSTSISHYGIILNKLCSVSGCGVATAGYSPFCNNHKRNKERHGHPLQSGVEAGELKAYRKRVAARARSNKANPVFSMVTANWGAVVAHSNAFYSKDGPVGKGAPFNRIEGQVHHHIIKLAAEADVTDIFNVIVSLYLLQRESPHRFRSDEAFSCQMVRRVRRLSEINAGSYFNVKTGRTVRAYRDLPPRVTVQLGNVLVQVFGHLALKLAVLEAADIEQAERKKADFNAALGALV
jgi:hypothetical protein